MMVVGAATAAVTAVAMAAAMETVPVVVIARLREDLEMAKTLPMAGTGWEARQQIRVTMG